MWRKGRKAVQETLGKKHTALTVNAVKIIFTWVNPSDEMFMWIKAHLCLPSITNWVQTRFSSFNHTVRPVFHCQTPTTRHDIIPKVSMVKHAQGDTLSHSAQYRTHAVFYQTDSDKPVCLSRVTTLQHKLTLVVVFKAAIHHGRRSGWVSGPQSQGWLDE